MNEIDNRLYVSDTATETTQHMPTIISALDDILSVSNHSELKEEELEKASASFEFIMCKLAITRIQALIIGMLIESGDSLQTRNMANYLGVNNISFLRYIKELEELVERKIVRKNTRHGDNQPSYEIHEAARDSYMNDEVYVAPKRKNLSLSDFIETTNQLFEKCSEERISRQELQKEISELTKLNQGLFVCKGLEKIHVFDQLFFYYCVDQFVLSNDTCINPQEVTEYTNPLVTRKLASTLQNGKNDLITLNLVQSSGKNGFGDKEIFTVSEEIKNQLMIALNIEPFNDMVEKTKGLKLHDSITPKKLFYNDTESAAMEELTHILSPENFRDVQERLEANGMRKGFACLFYGTPGTGKTESVFQLARATGRDIMEVNIANIKSKWIGDSEKNVKQMFNRYRNYCEHCTELPILLFNEADAIISKRSTNAERSVDKMENAIQNIILEEMEKLDGILIATTNLTSNMDTAFERRFLYKIEFRKPLLSSRINIWQSMLPDLSYDDAQALAATYDFSGGQIENIARKNIVYTILHNEATSLTQLYKYCDSEQLNKATHPMKKIGFCA